MSFIQDMVDIKNILEPLGHDIFLPPNTDKYLSQDRVPEKKEEKIRLDIFRVYFEEIKNADAILVINKEKSGVINYIGANALIEMSFAYVLNKKIYLWNPIPEMGYSDEIEAMKPVILNGDINLIQ